MQKPYIDEQKPYIQRQKPYIDGQKPDIERVNMTVIERIDILPAFFKTKDNAMALYNEYGTHVTFGRSMVENYLGIKSSRASEFLKFLLDHNIIEPVKGQGKGKYRFIE